MISLNESSIWICSRIGIGSGDKCNVYSIYWVIPLVVFIFVVGLLIGVRLKYKDNKRLKKNGWIIWMIIIIMLITGGLL